MLCIRIWFSIQEKVIRFARDTEAQRNSFEQQHEGLFFFSNQDRGHPLEYHIFLYLSNIVERF